MENVSTNITTGKTNSSANLVPHESGSGIEMKDDRPEALTQRKLQEAINNSPKQTQLKTYQKMADSKHSPKLLPATIPTVQFTTAVIQRGIARRPRVDAPPPKRAEILRMITDNRAAFHLADVAATAIRQVGGDYYDLNRPRWARLRRANSIAMAVAVHVRGVFSDDTSGFRVPTNKKTTKTVGTTDYSFYNDANGYLDFEDPKDGHPPVPFATGNSDVNIEDGTTPGTLKHTGLPLRNSRANHFKVANMERQGITTGTPTDGSASPAGLTWHHHKDRGRMQLIHRNVHKAFPHRGGFSRWGK